MSPVPFKVPYERPIKFTPMWGEWDEAAANALLAKKDEYLDWSDFRNFLEYDHIGRYEEVVYFLPLAIEYAIQNREAVIEFESKMIGFVDLHRDRLVSDCLWDLCVHSLAQCLTTWTDTFAVCEWKEPDRGTHGWYARDSDVVEQMLFALMHTQWLRQVLVDFLSGLARQSDNATKSAWLLECLAEIKESIHSGVLTMEEVQSLELLAGLVPKETVAKHVELVKRSSIFPDNLEFGNYRLAWLQ